MGYFDPKGQFVIVLPLFVVGFDLAVSYFTVQTVVVVVLTAGIAYELNEIDKKLNNQVYDDTNEKQNEEQDGRDKAHTPDQAAISDLVNEKGKKGLSNQEADNLLDWSKEYNFPHRDDRGRDHWVGGEHIHIGPKHVPIKDNK